MAYSDFDLKTIENQFQLILIEDKDIFSHIQEIAISDLLSTLLKMNVPLAQAIGTEKAKSELIIINIILELKRQRNIGLFSGIEFNIDKAMGLNGFCDFLISKSTEQLFIKAPVITIVEAKNDNILNELGQCAAEMIAARMFNAREHQPYEIIYGAVTTGHIWKFLQLEHNHLIIDLEDYYIKNPAKIVAILAAMVDYKI